MKTTRIKGSKTYKKLPLPTYPTLFLSASHFFRPFQTFPSFLLSLPPSTVPNLPLLIASAPPPPMDAVALEYVAFSGSSFSKPLSISRTAMGSLSSVSICSRTGSSLPQFRGLRISRDPVWVTSAAATPASTRVLRRSVVCQAHEADVVDVTKATWQSLVMESDVPVLVEFWAPWCGPCEMMHPIINELSKEYSGKLKCFRLNTDENLDIATQYGIRSVPNVMIFINGEKKDVVLGVVHKSFISTRLDKFL